MTNTVTRLDRPDVPRGLAGLGRHRPTNPTSKEEEAMTPTNTLAAERAEATADD